MVFEVLSGRETFYDRIGGQYIYPKDNNFNNVEESANHLNKNLEINGQITYQEYFKILDEYFDKVNRPWYYYEIALDVLHVKRFYWDYINYYANPNKSTWTPKNMKYSWSLRYIK